MCIIIFFHFLLETNSINMKHLAAMFSAIRIFVSFDGAQEGCTAASSKSLRIWNTEARIGNESLRPQLFRTK